MTLPDATLVVIEVDWSVETSELSCLATTSSSQCLETLGAKLLENTPSLAEIQREASEDKASKIMQKGDDIRRSVGANASETTAIQDEKMSKITQKLVGIQKSKGQIFTCDECGKGFGRKNHLVRHKKVHANLRPYTCDVCKKGFNYKQSLDVHARTHTGQRPYSCSYCGKLFSDKCSLRRHQRRHTGEKPYTCEECGKSFVCTAELKCHMDIHGDPYPCSTCDRTFTRVKYLKHHERRHHQGADVKISSSTRHVGTCNICGEKNVELTRHLMEKHSVRRENGEQATYECLLCGKLYALRSGVKQHLQSHASKKDFQCDMCGRLFLFERFLRKHQQNFICARKRQENFTRGRAVVSNNNFQKRKDNHIIPTKRKISCVDCGELLIMSANLTRRLKSPPLLRCAKCISKSNTCPMCGILMTKAHRCIPLKKGEIRCDVCKKGLYSEYYRTRHSCVPRYLGGMARKKKKNFTPKIVLIKEEISDTAAPKDVFTFKIEDSNISICRKDKENQGITLTVLSK